MNKFKSKSRYPIDVEDAREMIIAIQMIEQLANRTGFRAVIRFEKKTNT